MEDFQNQLNSVLGNPDMMQKIMAMAQSMQDNSPVQEAAPAPSPLEGIDISMVQRLSGLAGKSNIDQNQRLLLKALTPYISHQRITRLEKAMRAAKLASLASGFFGASGFPF